MVVMNKKKAQKMVNKIGKAFGKELTGSVLIAPYSDKPDEQHTISFAYGNGGELAKSIAYAMQRDKTLANLIMCAIYLYHAQESGECDE